MNRQEQTPHALKKKAQMILAFIIKSLTIKISRKMIHIQEK